MNDAQYNTPGGFGPRHDIVEKSLKSQLAAVGYTADKITYLAMSHWHGDHAGNANDYAASTWIMRGRAKAIFQAPAAQTPTGNSATFSALKSSKAIVVDGDHDVFGDGAVITTWSYALRHRCESRSSCKKVRTSRCKAALDSARHDWLSKDQARASVA